MIAQSSSVVNTSKTRQSRGKIKEIIVTGKIRVLARTANIRLNVREKIRFL